MPPHRAQQRIHPRKDGAELLLDQPPSTSAAAISASPTTSPISSTASARANPSSGARPEGRSSVRECGGCISLRAAMAWSSALTERRIAAAGLFSSWARPAASVPSPASFSRWRRVASMARSRLITVRMIPSAASGPMDSRSRTASYGMRSTSASETARTDAVRFPRSSAASSPWIAPGPTLASGTRSSPSAPSPRARLRPPRTGRRPGRPRR